MEVIFGFILERMKKDNTNTLSRIKEEESEETDNKEVEVEEVEEDKDQNNNRQLNHKPQLSKLQSRLPHEQLLT
jgi:hypothetical protein